MQNTQANLLLLDLDGTVRQTKSGKTFITKPDDQELISGVVNAMDAFSDWIKIGVTNQGGVAAGHKSMQSAIMEQQVTLELLPALKCIYFCPDYDGVECYKVFRNSSSYSSRRYVCGDDIRNESTGKLEFKGYYRKPNSGMIGLAILECEILPEIVMMVGNRDEDQIAADKANISFMWANDWILRYGSKC